MTEFSEDLGKLSKEVYHESGNGTLLSKYGIPVHNLEFDYIKKCTNGKELEKILKILQSGEEGYYPALTNAAEDRLSIIYPKSKLLRKACPVINKTELNDEEQQNITLDLEDWVNSISKNNKELENRKSNYIDTTTDVRKSKEYSEAEIKRNEKRISSTDYQSWDKYDPDTELLKIDLEEEKIKKEAQEIEREEKKATKKKKSVKFNQFGTEAEAQFVSNHEKEKGNEYFKAGDYEEALQCYTNSIESKITPYNLNNRAITYIKLKKYEKAVDDCDAVLVLDSVNEKALLRKCEALRALCKFTEAFQVTNELIKINPNNEQAQDLAFKLKKHCVAVFKKPTRMVITEVSDDEDDD